MNATIRLFLLPVIVALAGLLQAGCSMGGQEPTRAPAQFRQLPANHREHFAYYPSAEVHDSILMLRKVAPAQVTANEEFEYTIEVVNPTDKALLKNVVVRDYVSPGVRIVSSTPTWSYIDATKEEGEWIPDYDKAGPDIDDVPVTPPRMETQVRQPNAPRLSQLPEIRWFIEELYPQKIVTIKVRARASAGTEIRNCATADYEIAACVVSSVVAPELALQTFLEKEFIICATDQTDIRFVVSNSGTAEVRNVVVRAPLPEGITTVDGKREVVVNVGNVGAKQSKEVTQRLRVLRAGSYTIRARAVAAGEMAADSAAVSITAVQGAIAVAVTGPAEDYVGLPLEYQIVVNNTGNARVRDVVLEARAPAGLEFVDATSGGSVQGDRVIWRFDQLPAGQSQAVAVRFRGREPGVVRVVGTARGVCVGDVSEIVTTRLEGVPALLVEVVDKQDPNRVGEEEVYEIQVTNQGTAAETNIIVQAAIEEAQEFLSATGATPTAAVPGARTVTFQPLPTLAPKETAVWRVVVRCLQPGDIRFAVEVSSDQHGRPVRETEATSIYAKNNNRQ
ncbi:MAG TPA: hypothetical protein PLQ89_03210 [Phycisphaerae bacterium]|nr:hypothetical protein [Phycisphaerae bacterium]HOQ84704.1 hypothetical protein [Phycisphaerae bacterium]HPU25466.1 hypothetical protein [Phycisphaerae bacterium]